MSTNHCTPTVCGSCPLSGMCGDPNDLPPARSAGCDALTADTDVPDIDPNEPKPEGAGCCGGGCG